MKLNHLRYFAAVGERGSLRSAARFLGVSQPTITRSLQELERELGVKLIERTRVGVVLTPAGQTFLRRAQSIDADLQRTIDELAQFKGVEVGSVTVGLSTAALIAILPRIVEPFQRRFPKVWLSVTEGLFPEMETDVRDGLVDFYVGPVLKEVSDGALSITPLFKNRRVIIARAGHPLGHAKSIHELVDAKWLTTQVLPESELEVRSIYASAGLPPPNIVAQAKGGMSILSMVSSSDLLAPVPYPWHGIIPQIPIIQEISIKEVAFAPVISLVRRTRLPLTQPAEALSDLVMRAAANYERSIKEA